MHSVWYSVRLEEKGAEAPKPIWVPSLGDSVGIRAGYRSRDGQRYKIARNPQPEGHFGLDEPTQHLLIAILQRAFQDLVSPPRHRYEVEGVECMCPLGPPSHREKDPCPTGRPFVVKPAEEWIRECSHEPLGFGWIASALGRCPESAAAGMLTAAEQYRSNGKAVWRPNWSSPHWRQR